ncbi:MAG: hypothetical protein ACT4NY_28065 [Pseudonocardiales bacterium]
MTVATKIERSGPALREAQVARAKVGDVTGLLARDEHGNWVRL